LLSDRGYDIISLSNLYQVRPHTIRAWMNKWLSDGINGFCIAIGRGRKADIDSSNTTLVDAIKSSIALNAQNLNTVCQELNQSNGMNLTKGKLIRFLKKVRLYLSAFS